MAKPIDFEGMIAVYEHIGKSRDLTDKEIERVLELSEKLRQQVNGMKYRDANREKIQRKAKEAKLDPDTKEKIKVRQRNARRKKPHIYRASAAKWRANNPELEVERKLRQKEERAKVSAVEQEANVWSYPDKLAFWQRIATERELNMFEQTRLRFLIARCDPESPTSKSRQASNKKQWLRTLEKRNAEGSNSPSEPSETA